MSNLIQKITVKHKLNSLYRDVKEEYGHVVEAWKNKRVSDTSVQFSLNGLVNYATGRYNHICDINGVVADIDNDKRFDSLFKNIERIMSDLHKSNNFQA